MINHVIHRLVAYLKKYPENQGHHRQLIYKDKRL